MHGQRQVQTRRRQPCQVGRYQDRAIVCSVTPCDRKCAVPHRAIACSAMPYNEKCAVPHRVRACSATSCDRKCAVPHRAIACSATSCDRKCAVSHSVRESVRCHTHVRWKMCSATLKCDRNSAVPHSQVCSVTLTDYKKLHQRYLERFPCLMPFVLPCLFMSHRRPRLLFKS